MRSETGWMTMVSHNQKYVWEQAGWEFMVVSPQRKHQTKAYDICGSFGVKCYRNVITKQSVLKIQGNTGDHVMKGTNC